MRGLTIGQKASTERVFTSSDIADYNWLTDDDGLQFGTGSPDQNGQTVPGPLIGGMVSYLLGTKLPGRGTNWLKQYYSFNTPANIGELIQAEVEVIRLRPEKDLVNLRVNCSNSSGDIICTGEALVLVTDLVPGE
jgi:3-hydroxybutyryl-CoA dehydratase